MQIIKILYIEHFLDEKLACNFLERATYSMQHHGYACIFTTVDNGFIGLESTEHADFDLIITSCNLSGLNGRDMIRILRKVGSEIPFLLVLEELREDEIKPNLSRIIKDGFAGIIVKPFSSDKLCSIITSTLKLESIQWKEIDSNSRFLQSNPNSTGKPNGRKMSDKSEMLLSILSQNL